MFRLIRPRRCVRKMIFGTEDRFENGDPMTYIINVSGIFTPNLPKQMLAVASFSYSVCTNKQNLCNPSWSFVCNFFHSLRHLLCSDVSVDQSRACTTDTAMRLATGSREPSARK